MRLDHRYLIVFILPLLACTELDRAMYGHRDAVARVDGIDLTVDRAARLIAGNIETGDRTEPGTIDLATDLWVGYTLLALAYASPDSFGSVDVTPLIEPAVHQDLVWQLHRDAIMARADLPVSELRRTFESEQPWEETLIGHILIRAPEGISPESRDSLIRLAESIRQEAVAGGDFAELARRHSDDPSTAERGGRLGWVRRGYLISEVEEAVLAREPGDVSDVVRSPVGYHVIKIFDRRSPDFDSVRTDFHAETTERRRLELEQAFEDSLFRAAGLRFAPDAAELAQGLARSHDLERLSPHRRAALLARFKGGALTAGDFADHLILSTPGDRQTYAGADTGRVMYWLRELVRNRLLVNAARDRGYQPDTALLDSLRQDARRGLRLTAAAVGLRRPAGLEDEDAFLDAVDRAVGEVLGSDWTARPVVPVLPALRRGHSVQVFTGRFRAVSRRIAEITEAAQAKANAETDGNADTDTNVDETADAKAQMKEPTRSEAE